MTRNEAAREDKRFAVIKLRDGGKLPAPFALPCALEEGEEVMDGCWFIAHMVFYGKKTSEVSKTSEVCTNTRRTLRPSMCLRGG